MLLVYYFVLQIVCTMPVLVDFHELGTQWASVYFSLQQTHSSLRNRQILVENKNTSLCWANVTQTAIKTVLYEHHHCFLRVVSTLNCSVTCLSWGPPKCFARDAVEIRIASAIAFIVSVT